MTRRWVWALIWLNLAVAAVLVFVYPHLMVSPGSVVAAHTDIATDCFACHTPLLGASSARCANCHALSDIGLRTTKGRAIPKKGAKAAFHQDLADKNCMACHSDHAGPKLTQRSRKPFSHAMLRTEVKEQCQSCHRPPSDSLHRNTAGTCSQCHTQTAWRPATFDHEKSFVLDRDHNVECVTCHTKNDYKTYTCYGCHEHTPQRVQSQHREEGISNLDNCVRCHRSADGESGEGSEGARGDD